jgi:hypothetical protein
MSKRQLPYLTLQQPVSTSTLLAPWGFCAVIIRLGYGDLLEYSVILIQDAQVCSMTNMSSLYVTVLASAFNHVALLVHFPKPQAQGHLNGIYQGDPRNSVQLITTTLSHTPWQLGDWTTGLPA